MPGEPPSTYRVAGAVMIGSGLINAALSAYFLLALVLACGVGLLWVVPLAVAFGEMLVGFLAVVGVPMRFARGAAVVGIVNGAVLFDAPAVALEVLALLFLQQEPSMRFVTGPSDPAGPTSPTGQ